MKLQWNLWLRAAKWIGIGLTAVGVSWIACAQGISTTTVHGTLYLANGTPGAGTLQLSWPAFTTADNHAVAAGRSTIKVGADGTMSVDLAPNLGSSPAGLYYTAVYHMSDGTTSTEYWVIPPGDPISIAEVRAQVMPAAQAMKAVSKAYVDQAIQSITQGSLTSTGGQLTGPLYLNGDPSQPLQAANKHYVDALFGQALPLSGGTVNGSLTLVGSMAADSVDVTKSIAAKTIAAKGSPWWDVTAYGADPAGKRDSTAAFNDQIASCLSDGGTVFAPAGTYLVSGINMTRLAYAFPRCTLAGAGRDATTIMITQSGVIGINALGASNITVRDLTVSTADIFGTSPTVIQTGMLMARSTTSRTAAYNNLENVRFFGQFSNCGLVSIAAETNKRHNVNIENLYGSGSYPYTAFCTSGSNDFGVTVPSGSIYASTNTDNETWGDELYCDRGPNAICAIYSNGAGYRNFGSSIEVSNDAAGGIAVQLQNTAANIFNGPVEFYGPHIECNSCAAFYLKGLTGAYNYFNGIRVDGGNFVIYQSAALSYLVTGNDSSATNTYNILSGWQINNPTYTGGGGTSAFGVYATGMVNGSHINLRNPNGSAGSTVVSVSQFLTDTSTVEARVVSETAGAYSPQVTSTASGTSSPNGGLYAKGHIVRNSSPDATSILEWVVTTAGYVAKEAWTTGHGYSGGDYVTNASKLYVATSGGAAGSTPPAHTSGVHSDGTVAWLYVGPATTPAGFTAISASPFAPNANGLAYTSGNVGFGMAPNAGPMVQSKTSNNSSQYVAYAADGEATSITQMANGFGQGAICFGAYYSSGSYIATNTTANCIGTFQGITILYSNSGLTAGSTFVPIEVARIGAGGNLAVAGGQAVTLACWKNDGKTLGYATMSGGNISACN